MIMTMKIMKTNYLGEIYFEIKDFIQEAKIFSDLELLMNNLEKADFIGTPELNDFLNKLDSVNKHLQELKKALTSTATFYYSQNILNEVDRINDIQTKVILLHHKLNTYKDEQRT